MMQYSATTNVNTSSSTSSLTNDLSEPRIPPPPPPTPDNTENNDSSHNEPILSRTLNRFIMYPLADHELWKMYRDALSSFWVPGEIDLTPDVIDWSSKLTKDEKDTLSIVLAFFAGSDGIVNENLATRFMNEVTLPEARCFYGYQIMIENIHAETYADLKCTFIQEPDERDKLFNAIQDIECVADKAAWALKWSEDSASPFALRLAAFAAVEGIFFSSSFAIIFWLKSRGLMPGLCYANELISRDEGLHQEFACRLYKRVRNKPEPSSVTQMIIEAASIEKRFIEQVLPTNLPGMNKRLMNEYIEFVSDRLLLMLGYPAVFYATNPFSFMELISLEGKANFFERQVSSYRLPGVDSMFPEQINVTQKR